MATFLFSNNNNTTLAAPISPSAASITLQSGAGALFPNPSAGQQFALTLNDAATGLLFEICYCTARSGDVLTVVRAQEGTSARAWATGDAAWNGPTAGTMSAMQQSAALFPARQVSSSGAFTINTTDNHGYVGLNRVLAVATSSATLPAGVTPGDSYGIADLARNFQQFPTTITYPGGQPGPNGALTQVLNVNGQVSNFIYFGTNQWGFKP